MEKQEKIALINKKVVTAEYLQERAENLTKLAQETELAVNFLDHLCIDARTGNKDALTAFITCGSLGNVTDVLKNIEEEVSSISSDICPDM